ncbi:unnamed protein product [Moneuplotes crassus]|uniref:Uncharacterized protein n=1 Tax=Euplotes crassus TaxID=5936 RepID=A0AAD1XNJ5_EUPCR|nr:unnamed protein product [Moneuplotes crassus]
MALSPKSTADERVRVVPLLNLWAQLTPKSPADEILAFQLDPSPSEWEKPAVALKFLSACEYPTLVAIEVSALTSCKVYRVKSPNLFPSSPSVLTPHERLSPMRPKKPKAYLVRLVFLVQCGFSSEHKIFVWLWLEGEFVLNGSASSVIPSGFGFDVVLLEGYSRSEGIVIESLSVGKCGIKMIAPSLQVVVLVAELIFSVNSELASGLDLSFLGQTVVAILVLKLDGVLALTIFSWLRLVELEGVLGGLVLSLGLKLDKVVFVVDISLIEDISRESEEVAPVGKFAHL